MKDTWDDCDVQTQAMILAYDQIRQEEDVKDRIDMAKAMMPATMMR